jgi:hypothetical protein
LKDGANILYLHDILMNVHEDNEVRKAAYLNIITTDLLGCPEEPPDLLAFRDAKSVEEIADFCKVAVIVERLERRGSQGAG